MKLMTCPINGARALLEFSYGGEVRLRPRGPGAEVLAPIAPASETATREVQAPAGDCPEKEVNDAQWADYVFNRNGASGNKREWWCHLPSNTWFIAERDTARDEILCTYLYEPLP